MIGVGEELLFHYRWECGLAKPPQSMGKALWLCPVVVPFPPPQDSEADLLVQEFSRRHGKEPTGDSRGLGGIDCPLPSLAMQMLLRNGAETAGLWGLVSKKKDLFLSDAGREQFKLMIYVQRSISFPFTQKYVQGSRDDS